MAVLEIEGATRKVLYDQTVYTVPDSAQAAALVRMLEAHGINNYEITSPTIEEIFFRVAENMELSSLTAPQPQDTSTSSRKVSDEISEKEGKVVTDEDAENPLKLQTGKRIGVVRQALTLFRKRFTVFQRNWFPFCAAFLIPGKSHDTKKTINP